MISLNELKDCPVTHDDIKIDHTIFGPDLTNIRGKTVQCNSKIVDTSYVEITWELLSFHQNMMLMADAMFVNSVPFLVSASCIINLITIECTPKMLCF
jgi:hypothetical protein